MQLLTHPQAMVVVFLCRLPSTWGRHCKADHPWCCAAALGCDAMGPVLSVLSVLQFLHPGDVVVFEVTSRTTINTHLFR